MFKSKPYIGFIYQIGSTYVRFVRNVILDLEVKIVANSKKKKIYLDN